MDARQRLAVIGVVLAAACANASQGIDDSTTAAKPEWEPLEMSWQESGYWFSARGDQLEWRAIVESARPALTSCFGSYAASVDRCRGLPTPRAIKTSVHFRPWSSAPSQLYLTMEGLHPGVETVPDFREEPDCKDKVAEAEIADAFDSCVSHSIGEVLEGAPPEPGVTILFSNVPPVLGGLGSSP